MKLYCDLLQARIGVVWHVLKGIECGPNTLKPLKTAPAQPLLAFAASRYNLHGIVQGLCLPG